MREDVGRLLVAGRGASDPVVRGGAGGVDGAGDRLRARGRGGLRRPRRDGDPDERRDLAPSSPTSAGGAWRILDWEYAGVRSALYDTLFWCLH
ncbi:MAG TPA: hypothetical protein VHF25_11995 [Nitriliruptorales bacterium]|nr:hypothetical protein [Nitriliruptorales bacterium]